MRKSIKSEWLRRRSATGRSGRSEETGPPQRVRRGMAARTAIPDTVSPTHTHSLPEPCPGRTVLVTRYALVINMPLLSNPCQGTKIFVSHSLLGGTKLYSMQSLPHSYPGKTVHHSFVFVSRYTPEEDDVQH